jgi:NADH dehydrogenase [ubiquinone] 1 alpha subcomplex assembly factor 1
MTMLKSVLIIFALSSLPASQVKEIYTFSSQSNISEWRIVNDGVMGGVSTSSLSLTEAGHGQFSGKISLANNGGFASVQLNTSVKLSKENKFIVLHVKGDGKRYEFRLKGLLSQRESYVHEFATSGEWETIRLDIRKFYPQFRGRKLDSGNFNFDAIQQVSFLIANKREEEFNLYIDSIGIE